MNNKLLSAKELAAILAVSVRTIWRLRSSGVLPKPVTIGGSIRWEQKRIENWIACGCPDRKTFEVMKGGEQ